MTLIIAGTFILILLITLLMQLEEVKNQQKIINELKKKPLEETPQPQISSTQPVNPQQMGSFENQISTISTKYEQSLEEQVISFQRKLDGLSQTLEKGYQQNLQLSQSRHDKLMARVESLALGNQQKVTTEMGTRVNSILLKFEQNLADFLSKAETQSLESINLELRSARQLLDSYKSQQIALIDENIVAVLEKTINIVLKEKMTLKDQLDLVYEALEKAKLEKFFV